MTYVVDKLEGRGLLRRSACPTDRRVVFGELTDAGRALIERVFEEHAALLDALAGDLSTPERETAADLLKRLGLRAQAYRPAGAAGANTESSNTSTINQTTP
jgi:MarR family 2-MHQ and catechol resistance regulon transcriptional repressor